MSKDEMSKFIRERRKRLGLGQKQLAYDAKVSLATIWNYENTSEKIKLNSKFLKSILETLEAHENKINA